LGGLRPPSVVVGWTERDLEDLLSAYGAYDPYEGRGISDGPGGYDRGGFDDRGFEPRDAGQRDFGQRDVGGYDQGGFEEHEPQHRGKGPKLLVAAAIGTVALIVVGVIAFTGSLLMSKTSNATPPNSVAGAQQTTDGSDPLGLAATTEPNGGATSAVPTENATTSSPTPVKTTPAAPKTTQPGKPRTTAPGGGPGGGGGSNVAYENEVLSLVNVERAKAGCKPLAYNAKLRTAAYKHSADMAAKNYFSHDSQDGTSFATRISNEGYRWGGAAENIAKGQQTPADVMKAWMNSSGHRANILNCGLKDLGVGLAYQGKTPIWTQDFGSPL
jgi:uncharacterized protein YkwD